MDPLCELYAAMLDHDRGTGPAANTAWRYEPAASAMGRAMDGGLHDAGLVADLLAGLVDPDFVRHYQAKPTAAAQEMVERWKQREGRQTQPLSPEARRALVAYLLERRDLMSRAIGAAMRYNRKTLRRYAIAGDRRAAAALRALGL